MHMKNFFALLTDFGFDFAVASIKGVLLKAFSDAQIIDIDHSIEKFNLINAAFVIEKVYRFLPENTVFLCVVDPGVGSERDILCIELGSYRFIGPNNGIFHYLLEKDNVRVYKIQQECFNSESVTFHGRDIFAPAAISLTQGDLSILVPISKSEIVHLHNLGDQTSNGIITYIDSFGNIKTNISVTEDFTTKGHVRLLIHHQAYDVKFTRTFADVQSGELLCYKGSNATLEIAVNLGSAKEKLNASIGTTISLG